MSDAPAFFRAIEADPDNTPRLVYADRLDEHAKCDSDHVGLNSSPTSHTRPRKYVPL